MLRLRERARLLRRGVPLGDLLHQLAAVHGDRTLVAQDGPITLAGGARSLTYRDGAALVGRVAAAIEPSCRAGGRVVVRGPNDYGFFLACLAISRAGGVVVPVNPRMRDEEIDHVVADAGATVVDLTELEVSPAAATTDAVRPASPGGPADVAAIFYTSGTTGRPKGARLTHEALTDPAARASLWPARLRRDELVISLPIAHIMGFAALVGAAGTGIPVYFMPRFSPRSVLDAIEGRRATGFVGVPAMYRMMLEAGAGARDLSSVRVWISGADVMPADLARTFKGFGATVTLPFVGRSLGEALFMQGYGMVELGGAASTKVSPPMTSLGLGDVLGWSLLGWHMRVVGDDGQDLGRDEVGELMVKGPGVLRGYHGDPDRTREVLTDDGWVHTGDLARKGRLGVFHFVGRQKDVLMHGGYSVYPAEIEEVLRGHPSVGDAAVVGRVDPVKGEVPVAFVQPEPGETIDPEVLVAFGRRHLADYKAPVEIIVMDELPRTGTGKVAKDELRMRL